MGGLLLTTRRNDGRRTLLLNEDAHGPSPRGVHNLQYTQTNPYWWISRIHTLLVPLTLSSLLPSFLRCGPSIETRFSPLPRYRDAWDCLSSLKLSTLSNEIASPLRKDVPIIHRNWIINENQYALIVIFIITFFKANRDCYVCTFSEVNNKVYQIIRIL